MSLENRQFSPKVPQFSTTNEEIEKVRKEAREAGKNEDEAEKEFRAKIDKANRRTNFHVVEEGEAGREHIKAINETQEGIEDLSKLTDKEREAMMRELEGKKGLQ